MPAQPQPVNVTACTVDTDFSPKYLLSIAGRHEKFAPICKLADKNTN